jgi:1L-myo-inositol 1-phosphate cytidylyltransferase / CDP-L-myo-inositol myo-inositolphosphotransferase
MELGPGRGPSARATAGSDALLLTGHRSAPTEESCRARVAVVLAAGRSERLHAVTGGGSKALVRLGGLPMVERAVRSLLAAAVQRVVVVVGYHAGPVAAVVSRIAPGRVHPVMAQHWELGNGASLAAAEASVAGEELFLLLTADHLFSEGALAELLASDQPAALVDPRPQDAAWVEGTRVRIRGSRALAFGKTLEESAIDCGAFVLTQDVFQAQLRAAARRDASLAGAVSELAETRIMRAIPLPPGAWWLDIDTPADLRQARKVLRYKLAKHSDGPVSRYLNRPVSTRISMALAPLRISPDVASWFAAAVGIVAGWLLALGYGVAGALAAHACSVLDGVDGEVARLQVRATARGAMLDGVLDRFADAAMLGGLGVWALRDSGLSASAVLVLTVVAVAGAMLSMATKDRAAALGLLPAPERALGWLLGGRDGRLLLVLAGGLLGRPAGALLLIAITSAVSLAIRVALVRRIRIARHSLPGSSS